MPTQRHVHSARWRFKRQRAGISHRWLAGNLHHTPLLLSRARAHSLSSLEAILHSQFLFIKLFAFSSVGSVSVFLVSCPPPVIARLPGSSPRPPASQSPNLHEESSVFGVEIASHFLFSVLVRDKKNRFFSRRRFRLSYRPPPIPS